ncbi:hypothetical protein [uncultured Alloprevotella sp.]|uniref:hypothetical protein n=1 Tax=uncultured Alloprevotella sp. TaxID=1283315 RepID=UPI0025E92BAB|nr:hypothetical protein [uncultured Alloprevotella sp.]
MLNLTFRPNIFEKGLRFSKVIPIFALLKETCNREVEGLEELDYNDTDCESRNTNHWYEVYDGEMFEVDEEGDIVGDKDPVFVTKRYYNEFN